MKVTLTEMHSIRDAIRSMYMSKRTWTEELEREIDYEIFVSTDYYGRPVNRDIVLPRIAKYTDGFNDRVAKLFKLGQNHTTMLRFIDISVIVQDLHRGGTDDFDAHAKRLENRIIRSSTRIASYSADEMSDWYKGKIIPTDVMLIHLGIETPDEVEYEGQTYVRATNGYILKGIENDNDVKRGLYMLSLPMTFTFKVNLVELAHIYRLRGSKDGGAIGTAAPELQEMIESLMDQVQEWYPQLTREYFLGMEV